MSPKNVPNSLFDHCIEVISHTLNVYCCSGHPYLTSSIRQINHLLPAYLQAQIGEWIVDYADHLLRPLLPSQVEVVLYLNSPRLVVSGSVVESGVLKERDASHVLKLVLLYGGSEDRIPKIYDFINTASNLTHLECTNFCNDSMLTVISSSCTNLYCLDLRSCSVTDVGVIRLCGLNLDLKTCIDLLSKGVTILPTSPCSRSLRQFKITMTNIMEPGIAIILLILTRLTLLRVPDIRMERVFAFLQTLTNKAIQCNLKEFHSRQQLDGDQLKVLTNFCPNLEYIQVSFMGNFELDVRRIEQLLKLNKLIRAKFADVDSSALMWFLSQAGHRMKDLYLYTYPPKFSQEKVTISKSQLLGLAEFCSNIEILCLDGYSLIDDSHYETDYKWCFNKLKKLKLNSICLRLDELKLFILGSFCIEELDLNLQNPHLFQDTFIDQILDAGLWQNLCRLRILNAPLTSRSLFRLITECPKLMQISSVETWLVPKPKISDYKKWIKEENYSLEIL